MSRQGRIQSGTGVYHVMMRGINRQRIFEDSEDHYTFLQCLRSAQEQYTPLGDRLPNSCHYYAYALMSNHFHLLLHAKDDTVGNIVKRIASSYVYYFNGKYGRDGHLFKERFRSEPCEDWAYFVTLLRYIHQNPVKAGMVNRVSEYEFTSWHEYLGGADFFPLCNVNAVLGRISMDELTALVDAPLDNDVCCIDNPCSPAKKTRRCQTVATADRNRQKHNIKCIKKIILADRTLSEVNPKSWTG